MFIKWRKFDKLFFMDNKDHIEILKRRITENPGSSDLYYDLARQYVRVNAWNEAIRCLQSSIELDPQHVKSYIELANLMFSLDKIDKAVEICQIGIEYNPECSAIYYLLEQLYEVLGEYELASNTLEDLIRIDHGFHKAYEALGRLAIFQNKLDEARECLETLLEKEPQNVNAYIYLANIYRRQKEFTKAIDYLDKALQLDPSNLDTYNDLGLIYLESGDFEKAQEQFEFVVEQDSSYSFAFDNLGFLYRKLKEYEKAEEYLKKSISMNLQAWTYNELALVYTETGRFEESIEASKKAIAIDEQYAYAYDNLGSVYRKLGYYSLAREVLQTSLEIKPNDSWTYNQLGLLHFGRAEYVSAKAYFAKSIELDEEHPWPKINMAHCYLKEKEYQLAENYLAKLVNEYPKNIRVRILRSKLAFVNGNKLDAIEFAKNAVRLDPSNAFALANLGVIYRDLEDYEKAKDFFDEALSSPRLKDSSIYLEYAILCILRQDFKMALDCCIKAHESDVLNHNVYCLMAVIQNSSTLETKLLDYIKVAEASFPDNREVFLSYGASFLELNLPEDAERYLQQALEVDMYYKEAQYSIAQAYYLMGQYEKSLDYALVNTENVESVELSSYCGLLAALNYAHLGDSEKQEEMIKEVLQLNPTVKTEIYNKYKFRQYLKFTQRASLFRDMAALIQ